MNARALAIVADTCASQLASEASSSDGTEGKRPIAQGPIGSGESNRFKRKTQGSASGARRPRAEFTTATCRHHKSNGGTHRISNVSESCGCRTPQLVHLAHWSNIRHKGSANMARAPLAKQRGSPMIRSSVESHSCFSELAWLRTLSRPTYPQVACATCVRFPLDAASTSVRTTPSASP